MNRHFKFLHGDIFKNVLTLVVLIIVPSLTLYGCSLGISSSKSKESILKIGVIVPLSGSLAPAGLGMKNSVDLAIKNINKSHMLPHTKLELDAQDDASTPSVAVQVAGHLADDKKVIGVVGTLNSSTAQVVIPVLNKVHLAMVSPANTSTSLTQGPNWQTKKARQYRNYYRIVGYDANQGAIAANYIKNTLHLNRIAIVNDKKSYGVGLTNSFSDVFKKLGGTIVMTDSIDENEKNFAPVIEKLKQNNPEIVYYGGEFPQASLLSYQMKSSGLQIPLFGGDGIFDETYLKNCDKCSGDYATLTGEPLDNTETGKNFIKQYKDSDYKDPASAYGGEAYDAAYAIAFGISKAIAKTKHDYTVSREEVTNAIQYDNFQGVTSMIQFDSYGDIIKPKFSIYNIQNNKWTYITIVQPQDNSSS